MIIAAAVLCIGCFNPSGPDTGSGDDDGDDGFPEGLPIERVSLGAGGVESDGYSSNPTINADGRYIAFSSHATNLVPGIYNMTNVYVYDRQTGEIDRVSEPADGTGGDGSYVAFDSHAANLVPGDKNNYGDIFAAPVE